MVTQHESKHTSLVMEAHTKRIKNYKRHAMSYLQLDGWGDFPGTEPGTFPNRSFLPKPGNPEETE